MNWLKRIFGRRKLKVLRDRVLKYISDIKAASSAGGVNGMVDECRNFETFLQQEEPLIDDPETRWIVALAYHDLGMDYHAAGKRDESERCYERSISTFSPLTENSQHKQMARRLHRILQQPTWHSLPRSWPPALGNSGPGESHFVTKRSFQ